MRLWRYRLNNTKERGGKDVYAETDGSVFGKGVGHHRSGILSCRVGQYAETATTMIEKEIKNADVPAMASERLESGEIFPRKIMDLF